jgi:hypothetical protein
MIKLESNPSARGDLHLQDLGTELMLYDPKNDTAHVLNHTAMVIFKLCDGKHSLKDIVSEVKDKFKVEDGYDLSRDIIGFIEEFKEKGLLKEFL